MVKITETSSSDFGSKTRANILRGVVLLIAMIFITRLAFLQIVEGKLYKQETESQTLKKEDIDPFRGHIYGRNGEILVDNDPSFTVRITLNDFKRESVPWLAHILEIDTSEIIQKLKKYRRYSKYHPIKMFRDIDYSKVSLIEEYSDMLPGVDVTVETKRKYHFSCRMTHLIGYIRSASARDLKNNSNLNPGDMVGKSGLERSYEDILQGKKGKKLIAVDRAGRKVDNVKEIVEDSLPTNGYDLYITIDTKLQKKAEQLMRYRRGSIVALDPNNGEILCMVSKPDYNIRDFRGNISQELWDKLSNNRYTPLINRSVMTAYPPGSTWKMLVAAAAMQEGIITENTKIHCPGWYQYKGKGKVFDDHGDYGNINVVTAIKVSSNVFFYNIGPELGLEKLHYYGDKFGFGKKTKIDIPNETSGLLPTIEWVKENLGRGVSPDGLMVNYGIGQGEITVTPVQLAMYTAALANKGTVYQPHVVRAFYDNEKKELFPASIYKEKIPIDEHVFNTIHKGMYAVVNSSGGTAYNARVPRLNVCGKTGTAQTTGRDHSIFVCFAPRENPKIAIAVIAENAGYGADVAAPIAKELLQYYFYPDKSNLPVKRYTKKNDETDKNSEKKADGIPNATQ